LARSTAPCIPSELATSSIQVAEASAANESPAPSVLALSLAAFAAWLGRARARR
jgi:hypothetical protein